MAEALTRYYVCGWADRPGVLAPVAESFASAGCRSRRHQEGRGQGNADHRTHTAKVMLADTVADLVAMDAVKAVDSVLRVEGEEGE